MCHVNNSTIRPQGQLSPFSSLVPVRYSVHPLNGDSFEIWYFRNLALRQRSVLTSYTPIFSSLIAAARGLTCRGQLRKSFVSCQHHWNIFSRCETLWIFLAGPDCVLPPFHTILWVMPFRLHNITQEETLDTFYPDSSPFAVKIYSLWCWSVNTQVCCMFQGCNKLLLPPSPHSCLRLLAGWFVSRFTQKLLSGFLSNSNGSAYPIKKKSGS